MKKANILDPALHCSGYFSVMTTTLGQIFFLLPLSSLIFDIMENDGDENDDTTDNTADTTALQIQ